MKLAEESCCRSRVVAKDYEALLQPRRNRDVQPLGVSYMLQEPCRRLSRLVILLLSKSLDHPSYPLLHKLAAYHMPKFN